MKLTKEQLIQNAEAMIAFANGKPIEWDASAYGSVEPRWQDATDLTQIDRVRHRPRPEPKTRPWSSPDDVPGPVCWIKQSGSDSQLVTYIGDSMISFGGSSFGFGAFAQNPKWQYSTDRREWKPCTVTE